MLSQKVLNWKEAQQKVNYFCKTFRKGKKERQKKLQNFNKSKDVGHFLTQSPKFDFYVHPSKNVLKHGATGSKGMLQYCKCLLEQIGADSAHIQSENLQNVERVHFSQKAPGVNGLSDQSHLLVVSILEFSYRLYTLI